MHKNTFRCIHCLECCDNLYRRIGQKDIKLTICKRCNKPVDPYCERELFLVLLDLVLLRQYAYRHVMYNYDIDSMDLWKLFGVTSMLQAHLGMVAKEDRVDVDETFEAAHFFLQLSVVHGIAGSLAMLMLGCFLRFVGMHVEVDQVAKTYLIPALLLIATAAVHFWENSDIVRLLSSLMISSYRWIFLFSMLRVCKRNAVLQCILAGLLFIAMEATAVVVSACLLSLVSHGELPCSEWDLAILKLFRHVLSLLNTSSVQGNSLVNEQLSAT